MVGWVVADKALQVGISFYILVCNFWVGVFAKALFFLGPFRVVDCMLFLSPY